MCGIAGIVATDAGARRGALERMVGVLRHRGPDGRGVHFFRECALGHTRLSIVDLATGGQPMLSTDGAVAITFNGEVYGYREIKRALSEQAFRTTSDTEVILALYARHGRRLPIHLPGMFSFAIWDEHEHALLAARDRFGEKPFFFARGRTGEFLFASEIKALIASGLFQPRIDRAAVVHYLRHLYVHPHSTVYENVWVLPPAHSLQFKDGRVSVERYWTPPETRDPISEAEAEEEFRRLFEKAVERQLVADVPVGAFLSGGLDSTSVVAAASHFRPGLKTFSFGFPDFVDERPFARAAAQLYGTEHVELQDQRVDLPELLHRMADVYDEPFADSSNIPTYLISQAARRHGKVVLTGDGGDELLAGYDLWYRPLWDMEQSRALPAAVNAVLRVARRACARLGVPLPDRWRRLLDGAARVTRHGSIARAHLAQNVFFSDTEVRDLGLDCSAGVLAEIPPLPSTGTVDDALRIDLCDYLPGDILVKTDRASMAHGLELRAPFLDAELATFCISLPSRLKIDGHQGKLILRRCYGPSWPDPIRSRGKWGFGAPVHGWLGRPGVAALKQEVLYERCHPVFELISFAGSRLFVAQDNYQTWILLTLGLWLEHGREGCL